MRTVDREAFDYDAEVSQRLPRLMGKGALETRLFEASQDGQEQIIAQMAATVTSLEVGIETEKIPQSLANMRSFATQLFGETAKVAEITLKHRPQLLAAIASLYIPFARQKNGSIENMNRLSRYFEGQLQAKIAVEAEVTITAVTKAFTAIRRVICNNHTDGDIQQILFEVLQGVNFDADDWQYEPQETRFDVVTEPQAAVDTVETQSPPSEEMHILLGDPNELSWQDNGLCAQTDPEAFFPEKGGSTREAKKICLSCVVRIECLNYALDNDERFGIWGGTSEFERRRLRKTSQ